MTNRPTHYRSSDRRPKRRAPWAAYLWPGLPHLWIRGSWAGLLLAIGFTVLLHATVLATLVWPEWLPPRVVYGCGATLGLLWIAALWETRGELRRIAAERDVLEQQQAHEEQQAREEQAAEDESAETEPAEPPPLTDEQQTRKKTDALFADAQTQYLQADWGATERLLLELLRFDRDDIEAHLLLATLWRRTERTRDARRRLEWLARREAAADWLFEIERELTFCSPAFKNGAALATNEQEAVENSPPGNAETPEPLYVVEDSRVSEDPNAPNSVSEETDEPPTLQIEQPAPAVRIAPGDADRNAA